MQCRCGGLKSQSLAPDRRRKWGGNRTTRKKIAEARGPVFVEHCWTLLNTVSFGSSKRSAKQLEMEEWIWCTWFIHVHPGSSPGEIHRFRHDVARLNRSSIYGQGQGRRLGFGFRDGNPGKEIHQQSASVKEMSVDQALRRRDRRDEIYDISRCRVTGAKKSWYSYYDYDICLISNIHIYSIWCIWINMIFMSYIQCGFVWQ